MNIQLTKIPMALINCPKRDNNMNGLQPNLSNKDPVSKKKQFANSFLFSGLNDAKIWSFHAKYFAAALSKYVSAAVELPRMDPQNQILFQLLPKT